SFPTRYNPDLPMLGLAEEDFHLLEAYYDSGSVVTEKLEKSGASRASYFLRAQGDMVLDYFAHLPEDKAPRGRCLCRAGPDGKPLPVGAEMIRQMNEFASRGNFELRVNHPVQRLVIDESDRVIGVVAESKGQALSFKARKGVIFG